MKHLILALNIVESLIIIPILIAIAIIILPLAVWNLAYRSYKLGSNESWILGFFR